MDWWPVPANFPVDGNWFLASEGWAEPGEAHAYLASAGLSAPALILDVGFERRAGCGRLTMKECLLWER